MLSLRAPIFKNEVGLYRDDGLAICKATPKEIEKTKQEVCQVFKSNGLKITIEANKKVVNFLDVTFNLTNGCYKPFMKPNNKLSYVHQQSNHPPALLKNIPLNINKRLITISSSKEVFDESIAPYQKALTESGYDHKLTYNPPQEKALKNKRKRTRNITWYNPPCSLGKQFIGPLRSPGKFPRPFIGPSKQIRHLLASLPYNGRGSFIPPQRGQRC